VVSVDSGCFRQGTVAAQGVAAEAVGDVGDAEKRGHAPTEAGTASSQ
jgi:hypothetical protein